MPARDKMEGKQKQKSWQGDTNYCIVVTMQVRNGMAVILSVNIRENMIGVERRSDRVMSIKLRLDYTMLNVISAYAPQ